MEIDYVAWAGMALRWLHLITGIAWIGSSFYFIWLDNNLKAPPDEKDREDGVGGELWAVHGGGFYHKKKYQVAPDHMPEDLHWFKWEAYFTWISGMLLLGLIYYYGADIFLIDQGKMSFAPWQATLTGLGFLAGGWALYDSLCRSRIGENNGLFGLIWFGLLTLMTYALTQLFSDRGAILHLGAVIGTVMAANVFMVIIPNQKKTVASLLAGEKPDPALGIKAKQRSLHNNYMTLPVLLIMVSAHYPVMISHYYNWLIVAGLGVVAWLIRHFFNLKHKGEVNYTYPAAGALGFVVIMVLASPFTIEKRDVKGMTDGEVKQMIQRHCISCHSDTPSHEAFDLAPAGVMLDKMAEIKQHGPRIYQQVILSDIMPLGNETEMTEEERQKLGLWLRALRSD